MYLRLGLLAFAGLGAGAVIAAGIFAFLAIIGVFPRLIGVTHTAEHVLLYETLLILGGVWGNLADLYRVTAAFQLELQEQVALILADGVLIQNQKV